MKWLFLRGAVPTDRNPKEIIFDTLEECDDMWTHLFYNLLGEDDYGEMWYSGGDREQKYAKNYIERYVKSFKKEPGFEPDIIFARGGFEEYDRLLQKYPKAFKIYYGAGKRHIPLTKFQKYNLTLQDSLERWNKAREKCPNMKHTMWVKPAVDHLFYPKSIPKEYDICFIANGTQAKIKNIKWVYKASPTNVKILHLGNRSSLKAPKHITTKRVLRSEMATEISKCHIGIVPYTKTDSSPRVIPEMLACGIPIVVLDTVHFPKEKYIGPECGAVSRQMTYWTVVNVMLHKAKSENNTQAIHNYYINNISMAVASEKLRKTICREQNGK